MLDFVGVVITSSGFAWLDAIMNFIIFLMTYMFFLKLFDMVTEMWSK